MVRSKLSKHEQAFWRLLGCLDEQGLLLGNAARCIGNAFDKVIEANGPDKRAPKKIRKPLSQARLKKVLRYEPKTGDFFWRPGTHHAGEKAGSFHKAKGISIIIDRHLYLAHRLAWLYVNGPEKWGTAYMHHANGVKNDNRIENIILGHPIETHGHTKRSSWTPTYRSWASMLDRCRNPRSKSYQRYGAVGIRVCERWAEFKQFLADMGERPSQQFSLDRIDNSKGYEPSNCRWATDLEQGRNKTNLHNITAFGRTQCLAAWANEVGIGEAALRNRLMRGGWAPEKALTHPVKVDVRNRRLSRRLPDGRHHTDRLKMEHFLASVQKSNPSYPFQE